MAQTDRFELKPQSSGTTVKISQDTTTAAPSTSSTTNVDAGSAAAATALSSSTSRLNEQDEPDQLSVEDSLSLVANIKRYPKVVAYCLGLTLAVIGWGYDLVIVGAITAVDSFLEDYGSEHEGKLIIPALWLSLWLSLPPTASALGAVAAGWLGNRVGRRVTLMVGCAVSAAAVAVIFFSHLMVTRDRRRIMFTAGITVQGFSVGIIKTMCITYVSENAPTPLRGPALGMFPTFTLLGQLIGSVVMYVINRIGGRNGYIGAFGSQWVLSILPFLLACIMPESPAYLIRKSDSNNSCGADSHFEARALASCERLYGPNVDAHASLQSIRRTIKHEKASSSDVSYLGCFKDTNLRRTLIVCLAAVLPTAFGLDLLSNVSYFLKTVGMPSSNALLLTIAGVVGGMLANGAGIWIVSRVGRRRMVLVSLAFIAVAWGAMGVAGIWGPKSRDPDAKKDVGAPGQGDDQEPVATAVWVSAGLMVSVIVAAGLGCWPASFAVMGETSSLQLRAPTQGVGGITAQVSSTAMAVVLPLVFNPDAAALGLKTGFIFFGLSAIGVVVCWFFLPEMKDRTMAELDTMFAMRLPTRKFRGWRKDGEPLEQ